MYNYYFNSRCILCAVTHNTAQTPDVMLTKGGWGIEVILKAWYYANAAKVGHFRWLIMCTGVTRQKYAKLVSRKQATITVGLVGLLN